jgi:two-component system NtrC family sensor kinase
MQAELPRNANQTNDNPLRPDLIVAAMRPRLGETMQRLVELRAMPVSPEVLEELMTLEFHGARLARRLRALGQDEIMSFSVREPRTIRELLERVVEEVDEDCGRRAIELALQVEPALPDMWLDGEQLVEALRCILDNAIEAIGKGGHIVVRASASPGGVELAIGNDGPPVSGDILPHAFSPGVSSRRSGPGQGLGLTIVKAVADAVGGNVRIASDEAWTEVALRLPRARNVSPAAQPAGCGRNWVFPLPTAA